MKNVDVLLGQNFESQSGIKFKENTPIKIIQIIKKIIKISKEPQEFIYKFLRYINPIKKDNQRSHQHLQRFLTTLPNQQLNQKLGYIRLRLFHLNLTIFQGINWPNLKKLCLSYINIQNIESIAHFEMPNIQQIDLTCNYIYSFKALAKTKFYHLQKFHLPASNLQIKIQNKTFSRMKSLNIKSLNFNYQIYSFFILRYQPKMENKNGLVRLQPRICSMLEKSLLKKRLNQKNYQ